MKVGDKIVINGTIGFVKEFEGEDTLIREQDCIRWRNTDNVEQMIQSGEATLTPIKESK